jgi:hypothetical protein
MFQRLIDDAKASAGTAIRQTSLVAIAGLALFITISFLCAAGFVVVLDKYGLVQACLAGAGLFFVVALIAATFYMIRKRQIETRAAARAKSAPPNYLADPMVLATGLQLVRAIGVKRLLPLLAIGGLALGIMASRNNAASDETPAE